MLGLLDHYAALAMCGRLTNIVRHCHVRGLTSLMLHDEPGNRIRIFSADVDHELYRNRPEDIGHGTMTLGVHAHRTDVRLTLLFGEVHSPWFNLFPHPLGLLQQHRYESALLSPTRTPRLIPEPARFQFDATDHLLVPQRSQHLRAKTPHTVWVPAKTAAAWVVCEFGEDPEYESVCYTDNATLDPDLYQSGDALDAFTLLQALRLHVRNRSTP